MRTIASSPGNNEIGQLRTSSDAGAVVHGCGATHSHLCLDKELRWRKGMREWPPHKVQP